MPGRKLKAGKGARASILTRFIKPKQPIPNGDNNHRSNIILDSRFVNQKGQKYYYFTLEDNENGELLYGSEQYTKIIEEADTFFEGEYNTLHVKFEEPDTPWSESDARSLLLQDLIDGKVPLEPKSMSLQEIWSMHTVEYSLYDYEKFSGRVSSLRGIVKLLKRRKEQDQIAFNKFIDKHKKPSTHSSKGYIQWQGSDAQKQAIQDIKNGLLESMGYKKLYMDRDVYIEQFPFEDWSDKMRQEISKSKFIHSLKVLGKGYHRNKE